MDPDMSRPDGERIAMLEQHMKDQDDMLQQIVSDVKDIKNIVSKQDGMETRLKKVEAVLEEATSGFARWINPIIAAICGSVLTFLIYNFLQNLHH